MTDDIRLLNKGLFKAEEEKNEYDTIKTIVDKVKEIDEFIRLNPFGVPQVGFLKSIYVEMNLSKIVQERLKQTLNIIIQKNNDTGIGYFLTIID